MGKLDDALRFVSVELLPRLMGLCFGAVITVAVLWAAYVVLRSFIDALGAST